MEPIRTDPKAVIDSQAGSSGAGVPIGVPSRAPDLDVRPGFESPPPGYGEVPFYWWLGDPLSKERLAWQLDRLAGFGITGLQINYAHTDKGGVSYGLSMPSDPPLFSEAWWELVTWFAAEAGRRGMSISLSDYTLGLGQGWAMDAALAERPDLRGSELRAEWKTVRGGSALDWRLPDGVVALRAYPWSEGKFQPGDSLDLESYAAGGRLLWTAPQGEWRVACVHAVPVVPSFDPTHPDSGAVYIKHFFQPFEDRLPGAAGRTLNFFFSDELDFRLPGKLWSPRLAGEFKKRKGYDPGPDWPSLFETTGPRAAKFRLDYNDVRVALSEEGFFKPVYDWHERRGMIYGCDHGGRGLDVAEFGDYFRTQRWNQGPGSDQPKLEKNLIKAKVAASIAHLYERPRVWLEGYHSSGWGTLSADVVEATWANFVLGYNLLSFHGLYYSTHGGFWEWAPPDNHWRMPYARHLEGFMTAVKRLSYLLSQGRHVCDVAVMYPVAPVEAGLDGRAAVETAFEIGRTLYAERIDFDFVDFESVLRAEVKRGASSPVFMADAKNAALSVAGENYRVLILPRMRAIRDGVLKKVEEFIDAGGLVIAVGSLPEASDRSGSDDPALNAQVERVFGLSAAQAAVADRPRAQLLAGGGVAAFVPSAATVIDLVRVHVDPDVRLQGAAGDGIYFVHRRVGPRDVYALYGADQGTECEFRAAGRVELWDPWTGGIEPLPVIEQTASRTRLRLPLTKSEIQIVVFSSGQAEAASSAPRGEERAIALDGAWEVRLQPTLENRWGDFRWPPSPGFIGAETRRFRYSEGPFDPAKPGPISDDAPWTEYTASFGPMFRLLGPLPDDLDVSGFESRLASIGTIDPRSPVLLGGRESAWRPYDFSRRWGVEGDPGHQGYHGLKEEMPDDFIRLGRQKETMTGTLREREPGGSRYWLWTTVAAPASMSGRITIGGMPPSAVYLNGRLIKDVDAPVDLMAGANPLLVRYGGPGTGWLLVTGPGFREPKASAGSLALRWFGAAGILPFDVRPDDAAPKGWYRFKTPPGMKAMTVTAHGVVEAWIEGRPVPVQAMDFEDDGSRRHRIDLPKALRGEADAVLRIAQRRGFYGGAALPEPVKYECEDGLLQPGDWSKVEGLESYSGAILYKKTVAIPGLGKGERAILDLGATFSSAEVRINGRPAGVRVAPPWTWDVTALVRPGENQVEVLVANTLANHYSTIPTRYRGNPVSGLLGPVRLLLFRS